MTPNRSFITRISATISRVENLTALYALLVVAAAVLGLVTLPFIAYHDDQPTRRPQPCKHPRPYDWGGVFRDDPIKAQYQNSPAGYGHLPTLFASGSPTPRTIWERRSSPTPAASRWDPHNTRLRYRRRDEHPLWRLQSRLPLQEG